jgi:hypothetical protein
MSVRKFPGVKGGWRVGLTSPPSVSRLSKTCGSLDVSPLPLPDVLIAVVMKSSIFWVITPCSFNRLHGVITQKMELFGEVNATDFPNEE